MPAFTAIDGKHIVDRNRKHTAWLVGCENKLFVFISILNLTIFISIVPCTVIDLKICHLMEFGSYICSYVGIQVGLPLFAVYLNGFGQLLIRMSITFREQAGLLHYLVLCDENKFTADELQTLHVMYYSIQLLDN